MLKNSTLLQCFGLLEKFQASQILLLLQPAATKHPEKLHHLRLCLTIQLHNPFCSGYANGGPIIKVNDVRNDKPTGRRGARVRSPQGSGLIWMLTVKAQKKKIQHTHTHTQLWRVQLGNVRAREMKLRWWFSRVSYFCGSCRGQCCLSYDQPCAGENGKCTLSSTTLRVYNTRGIISPKN